MMHSDLYTFSANGQIQVRHLIPPSSQQSYHGTLQRWSLSFDCTASWSAHNGIVLSSIVTLKEPEKFILISGANDGFINVWYSSKCNNNNKITLIKCRYGISLLLSECSLTRLVTSLQWMTAVPTVCSIIAIEVIDNTTHLGDEPIRYNDLCSIQIRLHP